MKFISLLSFVSLFHLHAHEVWVRCPNGEMLPYEGSGKNVEKTISSLQSQFGLTPQLIIDFSQEAATETFNLRNYQNAVTASEYKDISYIVNTLGMGSLTKLSQSKSSLKNAGNRIDHIHPLRFLLCIFTDEKMKASMQAMQKRNWVYKEFIEGLSESLNEEADNNNLTIEQISDFALQLNQDVNSFAFLISERKWNKFISTLIATIPRNKDANRYQDM